MSCLEATFTLTPRTPFHYESVACGQAELFCYGADFTYTGPTTFESLHASNRFFFDAAFASDPTLDYAQWNNRRRARFLMAYLDLRDYASANKQLALIFGFDVLFSGIDARVLIATDAGLLQDQTLVYGDNQFLLEIDSLDLPLHLSSFTPADTGTSGDSAGTSSKTLRVCRGPSAVSRCTLGVGASITASVLSPVAADVDVCPLDVPVDARIVLL